MELATKVLLGRTQIKCALIELARRGLIQEYEDLYNQSISDYGKYEARRSMELIRFSLGLSSLESPIY